MRIFHDLLMLQGHIADPRLARELAGVPRDGDLPPDPVPAVPVPPAPHPAPGSAAPALAAARFGRGVTTLCATALSLFR